jgi:hypothetical protein
MARRDDNPERSLNPDAQGIPDLDAPPPGKEITGDPQEGLYPPRDRPVAALDDGTTPREERTGLSLDDWLSREERDLTEADVFVKARQEPHAGLLVDSDDLEDDEPSVDDDEADAVAWAVDVDPATMSAEEAAVHVIDDDDED